MKEDNNGIKFFEEDDRCDAYGAITWQKNFETVSMHITKMRKELEHYEMLIAEMRERIRYLESVTKGN